MFDRQGMIFKTLPAVVDAVNRGIGEATAVPILLTGAKPMAAVTIPDVLGVPVVKNARGMFIASATDAIDEVAS